jgi:predicted  nucleic acid-binding Zn-ribbon protein
MPLTASPADQALLLDLQALDTRLAQLSHRISTLPEETVVSTLEGERATAARTAAEQRGELEDAQAELRRVESDVAVVEARVVRDTERVRSTSSVKDVEALEAELASLAKRTSDLEDIELAVMETVEERERALAVTTTAIDDLASRIADATAARDAARDALADEAAEVDRDRAALVDRIPADLLALYEKQRARYGSGASHLRAGVTSASGVTLNASDLERIRAAAPDEVVLCPDSNAILVRTAESGL